MSAKNVQIAHFRPRAAESARDGTAANVATHLGHVVAILDAEQVAVTIPDVPGRLPARLAVHLTRARLQELIASRRGAVILVDTTGSAVVLGFLEGVPSEVSPESPGPRTSQAAAAEHAASHVVEADVDGKRVRIVGHDEIVLECGAASITLRRNGRVIIRGSYVETDSAGTNRIKGAAVRIN